MAELGVGRKVGENGEIGTSGSRSPCGKADPSPNRRRDIQPRPTITERSILNQVTHAVTPEPHSNTGKIHEGHEMLLAFPS